jgi:hypothetical protein
MAQNAEQGGQGVEWKNLNKKLNTERDMERIMGAVEKAWEKVAVEKKTEMAKRKTVAQTEK